LKELGARFGEFLREFHHAPRGGGGQPSFEVRNRAGGGHGAA